MAKAKRGAVMYSADGRGNWWRTEWKPQCKAHVYIMGHCQGFVGHKGVHWRFGPSGSFEYSDNKNDPSEDGCSGSIPPGHKTYRTPESMQKHLHLRHRKTVKVKDKRVLAMLEKDKTPERNASTNRPVRTDELE